MKNSMTFSLEDDAAEADRARHQQQQPGHPPHGAAHR